METDTAADVTVEQQVRKDLDKLAGVNVALAAQLGANVINPIQLAKFLKVRPQMIYNYIRDNRIPGVRTNDTGKIVIDLDSAVGWIVKRREAEAEKAARIEQQLNGE